MKSKIIGGLLLALLVLDLALLVPAQTKMDVAKVSAPPTGPQTSALSDSITCPTDNGCQVTAFKASFTDRSTSITTGGTSQTIVTANGNRKRLLIQNPCTATSEGIATAENVVINFTSAASLTAGTGFELLPCGSFDTGLGPVTTEAITGNAATSGHKIAIKEQ